MILINGQVLFLKNVQELDGVVESIPGDLISSYFKN